VKISEKELHHKFIRIAIRLLEVNVCNVMGGQLGTLIFKHSQSLPEVLIKQINRNDSALHTLNLR
jgi:hypothetical protein